MKILDFGISKFASVGESVTQTGTSMGTPAYMSPEQVRGEKSIGPQCDLYSIGAFLYYLVSGHPPFEGGSDLAVVAQVLTEAHRPLDTVRPDVPVKLALISDRLLIKAADKRPADASQVRRAIEAVAAPDYEGVWAAAKVAFQACSPSPLETQTPTPANGGHKGKTRPSRPSVKQSSPETEARIALRAPGSPRKEPVKKRSGLAIDEQYPGE